MPAFQDGQLLPECEIFQDEIPATAKGVTEGFDPDPKQAKHGRKLHRIGAKKITASY